VGTDISLDRVLRDAIGMLTRAPQLS